MKEMTPPFAPEPKFFERVEYGRFLSSLGTDIGDWQLVYTSEEKEEQFNEWLRKEEAEDFKNLVPMHIRMSTEEFNWFMAKVAAEDEANIPNLKAIEKHRPHGFKDLK